jgi:hypothetical protein
MTMKLPLLPPGVSVKQALAELTTHRAGGAVVKIGPQYRLVLFDDVVRQAGRDPNIALREIKHEPIATKSVVRTEGASVHVDLDATVIRKYAPPLYFCPKGDYQSQNPGTCPYDGEQLQPVNDE